MSETPLPYVAKAPWYIRTFVFGGLIFTITVLWLATTPTAFQFWQESPWLFRVVMIMTAIGISIGVAGILLEKTIFTETGIKHRTKFLRKISRPYSDIRSLVYDSQSLGRPESLEILFADSNKVFITGGQANLGIIIEILKANADSQIVIRHR
jgi:uncharacterized membrane protein